MLFMNAVNILFISIHAHTKIVRYIPLNILFTYLGNLHVRLKLELVLENVIFFYSQSIRVARSVEDCKFCSSK